jgi:hypothetical protein
VGGALRHLGWSTSEQKTKPPGRFTLASLIKALERHGLGRPSTYANIMSRILTAGYVVETRGKLFATDTGKKLTIFLKKAYADNFIELNYTAKMEESLDDVANGKVEWQGLIDRVSRDLQVKARQAGLSYDVLAGESRSVAQDDGRVWGKPERLQPCNRCGKPIGFIKSEQWIPVDETGIRHRCAPTAKGSQAPKTTRSKGSGGSSKRR